MTLPQRGHVARAEPSNTVLQSSSRHRAADLSVNPVLAVPVRVTGVFRR